MWLSDHLVSTTETPPPGAATFGMCKHSVVPETDWWLTIRFKQRKNWS